MSKNKTWTAVATALISVMVAAQGYISYTVVQLDTAERYSEIPTLLGLTILMYALILFLYMRVFIGANAYKLPPGAHGHGDE